MVKRAEARAPAGRATGSFRTGRSLALALLTCFLCSCAQAELWRTGYYPGWEQNGMPASQIDFTVITHVIHFSLVPNSDGSLNTSVNGITSQRSADVVAKAHTAGRKALICVGGANSQSGFQGATSPANLAAFINNLTNLMVTRGYDGIDVDWEQLIPSDEAQYTTFISSLRAALDHITPRPLLTAAIASPPTPASLIASLQHHFDQINLMTYDLSGPYPGWVTWFNAPIYDGGYRFPSTSGLVPSANGMVSSVINAGVPPEKLGVGIAFYGWIWSGGSGTPTGGAALPRQPWTTAPAATQLSYNNIMSTYYHPDRYRWDEGGQAAYLTLDNPGSADDKFISYDDERTCQSKVSFARNRGLGGVMIWQLAQAHHPTEPDPLLEAVKQALATPGETGIQFDGEAVTLRFDAAPLGAYRVQWTTNLNAPDWNTLLITNITSPGEVTEVIDTGAITQRGRFYRVQTPP